MAHWGYCKNDGPATWPSLAPAAKGKKQSPIDIMPSQAKYDAELAANPLKCQYDPNHSNNLFNNGHSVQVAIDHTGSSLTGGPLKNKFEIAQFHFHWGKEDQSGSEHRVDGKMYASELHLVHYNTDKFASFGDAASQENGLAVLGVFIQPGKEHPGLKQLTDHFSEVAFSQDSIDLKSFDPACLLPEDTSKYWTYSGSLTTPPCFESVNWIVFKQPIEVSEEQLKMFRGLHTIKKGEAEPKDELHGCMYENYRPPLPLEGRVVRASFQ